ncbi:MAG: M23 family metallopeptidase [Acetobacter sp.]|nr:M23 family metallopeptidase [Acetobacter sp.]
MFSEKEFIIRSNGKMKIFKISTRLQWSLFVMMLGAAIWTAYSYRMYSVSDRIISYQEQKLDETRSAYVDLMSDFVTVHKNITSMVEVLGKPQEQQTDSIEEYLKKAEVIEERIRQITANEDWISEKELNRKNAVKEAILRRDVAVEEKNLLEEKVKHLEEMVRSLQAFEFDLLQKVETVSNKEIDKLKSTISTVNGELKKRGKYFNPLANSKKNSRGGEFIADEMAIGFSDELIKQAQRAYTAVEDINYYQEAVKKIPLGKPVWTYWLSSPFGKRSDPFNAKSAKHKGVDLASNKGNKIKTMAEGKVTRAGMASGYGKMVEIDHGNGFKTKYGHMNAIYVKQGQMVEFGQTIGEVGSTGRSTGPHLHYEVLYDGVHLNPMVFIKAK